MNGAVERIPILRLQERLIVIVQSDLHDRLATTLRDDLGEAIAERPTHGVLIDISALDVVDSFVARMLGVIALTSLVMNARTVLVGMQPSVAITLVEMGVEIEGVYTAIDAEAGFALLDRADGEGLPYGRIG